MSNPRKGSYGYVLRLQTDIDLNTFNRVWIYCSASSNGGFTLDTVNSTAFVGQSTVYAQDEGLRLLSGQWIWGQNLTTQAFNTADDWSAWVEASATGKYFRSPTVTITVDP